MNQVNAMPGAQQRFTVGDHLSFFLSKHWFSLYIILLGLFVGVPFLAPLFMKLGWVQAANGIYVFYSYQCHQLPERSFFFFGEKISYSIPEIQAAWKNTLNPAILRQFTGNASMGWKVAWSDRMVSMYGSLWLSAVVWKLLRGRLKALPWWGFALFALPMALDGGTHFLSDLAGIGLGFRDSNLWLAALTRGAFSPSFYAGDAVGSFNSWMRLLTGILFGIGGVWFAFPYLEQAAKESFAYLQWRKQAAKASQPAQGVPQRE